MAFKQEAPALFAEFVGTFVLVLTVGCVVLSSAPAAWGATSIACVLMVMIYSTAAVSGGNLNPAVSVSLGLNGQMEWPQVGLYSLAQLLGGCGAGGCVRALFGKPIPVGPVGDYGFGEAFFAELIYTAMLCFVVNCCAVSKRNNPPTDPNQFYALAIGFVIVAGGYAVGPVSGAAFNPAVACGLAVTSGIGSCMSYAGAQFLGCVLGTKLFGVMRGQEELLVGHLLETFSPTLAVRCMSEVLGTFVLVLTVGLNLVNGSVSTAWSAAAALMCMIYSLG
eukprot:CAMPEP_0197707588 /NCGR_PEP_ID=MMETSP1338-20131121/127528_1 /TAXON_ID=43686 ORGANISM="Pelagodinium beii, Strain RCC1491" /NCGR_SAMPLE_ID=MMETSP1338 /ASSEMBLY_ACC=CAM_ASM_000754 /LENGTH=277 /DNA_ID=CAMNT_0043291515 /DNA_START=135 /DNA_END=965 /DNA_ORIENTATION=-